VIKTIQSAKNGSTPDLSAAECISLPLPSQIHHVQLTADQLAIIVAFENGDLWIFDSKVVFDQVKRTD
jgi:hypothetical protein